MTVTVSFAGETTSTTDYSYNGWSVKVAMKVDKNQVKPGDEFKITLSVENISGADTVDFTEAYWSVCYDYVEKLVWADIIDSASATCTEGQKANLKEGIRYCNIFADTSTCKVTDLTATVTVKIKDTAAEQSRFLDGDLTINTDSYDAVVYFDDIPISITNNPTDPTPTEATYTVSAKPSVTSAYVGDTFNVDVVASADQAADLAAVDAVLNYDKDLVKPIGATAKAINTTATPLYYTDGTNGITTDGTGKVYLYGSSAQTGTDGLVVATYQFEALKSGTASFSIADGAKIGKSGTTADIAATSGTASTVAINEVPDEKSLISNADYKGAPTGKQVLKYVAKDMPASGNAYFYGEDTTPLYYAYDNNDGKHVFLGFVDAGLTNDTLAAVTEKTGNYETLSYTGDINKNDSINAVDSLIAYDLATGVYSADSDMSTLTAQRRLEADINKDGAVTAADARAIMFKALGIADPELAQ